MLHRSLDSRFDTLAEQLQAKGYQTVGLASNGLLSPNLGFDQGFQTYWCSTLNKDDLVQGSDCDSIVTAMHAQLAKWLTDKYDAKKPFFLFLNYIEAHQQYRPPRELLRFASDEIWSRWQVQKQALQSFDYMLTGADSLSSKGIAEMEALYDDEICYVDRKVGDVLEFLKATGSRGKHGGDHYRRPRRAFRRASHVESRILAL